MPQDLSEAVGRFAAVAASRRSSIVALVGAAAAIPAALAADDAGARKGKRKRRRQRRRGNRGRGRCGDCCPDDDEALALVRVVHASPDAPNVDVYVDDALAIEDLPFGEATDLLEIPAGTRNIKVTPAGAAQPVVIDADVPFAACTAYEVSATGFLSGIQAQVYEIDRSALDHGTARVRAIHNSPDAPPVKIVVAGQSTPLFDTFAFPTATGFAEVPAGTYDLEIRIGSSDALVLALDGVELEGDTVYDVFAIGSAATEPQGEPFDVLALTAEPCCD